MPFRRSYSRSRYPRRRSFRRGTRLHAPHGGRRWERANVFFDSIVSTGVSPNVVTTVAVQLALVSSAFSRSGGEGRALAGYARALEIGGVVLSRGTFANISLIDGTELTPDQGIHVQHALVSDRVGASGAPSALVTSAWEMTQAPVAEVTTSTPLTTAEDVDYPLQIHYRETLFPAQPLGTTYAGVESGIFGLNGQAINNRLPVLNKRLRLRLGDLFGLYYCFSFITPTFYAPSTGALSFRLWLHGSVYYRVRF